VTVRKYNVYEGYSPCLPVLKGYYSLVSANTPAVPRQYQGFLQSAHLRNR
jgi:hypothetical protein